MAKQALGLIETRGLVPAVEATDVALKAANVSLAGFRTPGSGLVSVALVGDVAAVRAATEAGAAAAARLGEVLSVEVLSRPHDEIDKLVPGK
ncbi:MAG: BMC domain-containing protein [Phycisphaerales bacterium]|nr:BMC domain-containing protein [Phycisphaerales bacterium]